MKTRLLALLLTLPFLSMGQQYRLISDTESAITIDVQVPAFETQAVTTPQGEAYIITAPKAMKYAQAGEPDLPMLVIPTMIGDQARMQIEVTATEYVDYENMLIAPSKGDFPRSINPEDVPYSYGDAYQNDAFFPSQLAKLDEPYIHRDVRAQNIMVTPYQYNPITKTLRVYTHMVLNMVNTGKDDRNIIENRAKSFTLDSEFNAMYERRYINYKESMSRYNAIEENGELLIICHDDFMTAMEPFVTWKKQIGRPTTMVGTTVTGNTAAAIKSYIETYYAAHPNLTDILLVGDVAQIPGVYISAGTGYNNNYSGYGDAQYGQLAGNDYYNEVIVGRFCCETEAQVTNHVNKVLNYERDLDETATWLSVGQGVSKNEGAGNGHYGEADHQHIDNIRNDLLAYNYTEVHRDYQGVTGVTSSAAIISQHINAGVSIINYCNHGNETSWGVFSYNNSNVNALTNDFKLPYIISVACLNGKYDRNGDCFAEAWMRATNNSTGNPTGAIGGMFSYISQPWTPPQYGQDEMVDILVESYTNNIKRTMGGVSINGNMAVLDRGASQNPNKGTYNTWILYGDPTLTLRNAVPADMGVSHDSSIDLDATSFTVTATNGEGALATLTRDGEIMGSAIITNGSATIEFTAPGEPGEATLTVFGYNKITYIADVNIATALAPVNVTVTASETIFVPDPASGESNNIVLTAVVADAATDYTYRWAPANVVSDPYAQTTTAIPESTTTFTCTATNSTHGGTGSVTVIVVTPPARFRAEVMSGNEVLLTWSIVEYADSYSVYREDELIAEGLTERSYTDNYQGIATVNYSIRVNYQGHLSQPATTSTYFCVAPENVQAEYTWNDGEFYNHITWAKNPAVDLDVDQFIVYRSSDGENFEELGSVNSEDNVFEYAFDDATAEIGSYEYYISATYKTESCVMQSEIVSCMVTAVGETSAESRIYPNPTTGKVTVYSEDMKRIVIVNSLGQTLYQADTNEKELSIDLATYGKGLYFILIHSNQGVASQKVVVD